jgi:hypothetical protein
VALAAGAAISRVADGCGEATILLCALAHTATPHVEATSAMDRTARFHILAPSRPRVAQPSIYSQQTSHLDYEISALEHLVKSPDMLSEADVLHSRLAQLERALKALALPRDAGSQALQHMERVQAALERRLKDTTKMFKQALEARAFTISTKQERHEQLFGNSRLHLYKASTPPPGPPLPLPSEVRRRTQPLLRPTYNNSQPSEYHVQQQQQQLQHQQYEAKAHTRLSDVRHVEKKIHDTNQMFLHVATMLNEQGHLLNDVEANLDDTLVHSNEAQSQLLTLFRFVSGDRQLILGILLAVTVVGCVIIYFLT